MKSVFPSSQTKNKAVRNVCKKPLLLNNYGHINQRCSVSTYVYHDYHNNGMQLIHYGNKEQLQMTMTITCMEHNNIKSIWYWHEAASDDNAIDFAIHVLIPNKHPHGTQSHKVNIILTKYYIKVDILPYV